MEVMEAKEAKITGRMIVARTLVIVVKSKRFLVREVVEPVLAVVLVAALC
jgi:hypothetical protein